MTERLPRTIAVCVKFCPDTTQLKSDPRSGSPRIDDAPQRISTFDENALEEAARLKERCGGRIVVVSLVAAPPPPELVQRALAMGADEARLIMDPAARRADALATARILSAALRQLDELDLVVCGEGSLDIYDRQVGPRVAEELEILALCQVTKIELCDDRLVVHRSLLERTEIVSAPFPALVTVGQEINEPRCPTVLQIMGASSKPVLTSSLSDLGFDQTENVEAMSGVRTLEVVAPGQTRRRIPIEGEGASEQADQLAAALFEQGLVHIE